MSKQNTQPEPYKNLIDLMSIHAEATTRLDAIKAELQASFLDLVDDHRAEYAELQAKITETETAIEHIARDNPSWFESARSIKTPYGQVKFHSSKKLDIPNEEASALLIQSKCSEEEQERYLRTQITLNIEALEKLSDAQLAQFRINRVQNDNFSLKAGTIDLGKAVKQAADRAA
jgi:DNA-dependent RNA polymerase auxiliary subunit epsilon